MTRDGAGQVPSFSFNPGGLNKSPGFDLKTRMALQEPRGLFAGSKEAPGLKGKTLGDLIANLPAPEGAPDRRFFKGPVEEIPIEDVGPVSKPNLRAKDPFARMTKTKGALIPLAKGGMRSDIQFEESLVKGRLKEFEDPITKIVMSDPDAIAQLRSLDPKKISLKDPEARRFAAQRYEALLRTLKGSDPEFTAKATMAMPTARAAWQRSLFGKLKGTEEWLTEQNGKLLSGVLSMKEKQALNLAQKAFILAKQTGDDGAKQLAADAAWYARKGDRENFTRATSLLEQANARHGAVEPGSPDWYRTFNPRAAERVEAGGGSLAPNIGGGPVLNADEDSIARITRVASPEETRPGAARTDGYGKPFVEPMPAEARGPSKGRRGKAPLKANPDWFKVMDANRELENELIRRGMPKALAGKTGFKGAGAWAAANVPGEEGRTLAHLHGMFQGIRMGAPGAEIVAKDVEGSKAATILELLLDEGVRAPEGDPPVRMKRPAGGLNVNRLVDDMPYLPPIEEFRGRRGITQAIGTAEQEISPMALEWLESKLPKSLGKLAGAILRGVK